MENNIKAVSQKSEELNREIRQIENTLKTQRKQ